MRKIIIDCDTGTDDAIAVLGLLLAKNTDVMAITAVHGNISVEDSADNDLQIIDFLGLDIPVYKGCDRAMVRHLTPGRSLNTLTQRGEREFEGESIRIHERDIKLTKHNRRAEEEHAVSYLVRTLKNAKEPIDICATGPLTNLAMAITMQPDIVKNIGTIFIMGGGIYRGNRTPVGEANFVDDPEAAEIVMKSGAKMVIGPIEGNESGATYTLKDIEDIEAIGNETALFAGQLLRRFIWRCGMLWDAGFDYPRYEFPKDASCCVHDWAAVAPAIDEKTITQSRMDVCRVDFSGGMSDGQLVIDRRGGGVPNAEVVYEMDEKRCKGLLLELLKTAPR